VYIAEEVEDNQFEIAGGEPGMKVSWQVTGIRADAYARSNPSQVEREKSNKERGLYLHPEAFGLPFEKQIDYEMYQEAKREQERVEPILMR